MGGPRPTVYTIPPGVPFVDALAEGILAEAGDEPLALARTTVLMPTRRACRGLAEAFLRARDGRPLILPRLQPIGDIDEDDLTFSDDADGADGLAGPAAALELAPAISPGRRRLLLARTIMARQAEDGDGPLPPDQAAWLAEGLARFLDQAQTEQLDFAALDGLVPEDYAEHWKLTLEFLQIVTRHWPEILAEEGASDPAVRRNALIAAQAEAWRRAPPADPVIAAGSTGSVPATAELLKVVAGLPAGALVLPGLDLGIDDESWAALDPAHPQYGLGQLLARLEVGRDEVRPWPAARADERALARQALVTEAMRPAATSDAWRDIPIDRARAERSLEDVVRVDCPGPQEEAGVIALMLRGALEDDGKTAALVTPDRDLARRVAAELRRWGIEIDDSAGTPLAATPPGSFLRLAARMLAEDLAPVPLLAACKHPLAAGGRPPASFRGLARRLERAVLRGPRPAPGFAGLREALAAEDRAGDARLRDWLGELEAMASEFARLLAARTAPLAELVRAHLAFAEALAASDAEPGAARLWAGEAGEQAANFANETIVAARGFPDIQGGLYPNLFEAMMSGQVMRPRFGLHPRLHIWGPLEARLLRADLVVLGGLNEGTWPAEPESDPWMSRQMRERFGLPPLERRLGLAAHDFAEGFSAREVALTRSVRVEGTPTVPSRWLLRLETVLSRFGLLDPETRKIPWAGGQWLDWQRRLDAADRIVPIEAPAPRPPVAARPRRLSVTQVETWQRNPYAVYARWVLGLKALDPLDADPGAAEYGTVIHAALDRFVTAHPDALPNDAGERLREIGRACFAPFLSRPGVWAFWWPRFERIAEWFVEAEQARRAGLVATLSEAKGELTLAGPAGPFTLSAHADRIDRLRAGGLAIIDYKTGGLPSSAEVDAGWAPQLPLEAAIARAGGFEGVAAGPVEELAFWRLSGGDPPGEVVAAGKKLAPEDLATAAREGLERLIAAFDDPATPYRSRPDPRRAPRFSDYEHLARVKEWSVPGLDAGGDGE